MYNERGLGKPCILRASEIGEEGIYLPGDFREQMAAETEVAGVTNVKELTCPSSEVTRYIEKANLFRNRCYFKGEH